MPPAIILRAADARPFELQDLLPSDTRFKLVVYAGDIHSSCPDSVAQKARLERFAEEASNAFLKRFGGGDRFDIITILLGDKLDVNYTSVPAALRSHWSKSVSPFPSVLFPLLLFSYLKFFLSLFFFFF